MRTQHMLVPEVKVESKKYGFKKIDLRFCAIVETGFVIKWGYETRLMSPVLMWFALCILEIRILVLMFLILSFTFASDNLGISC